MPKVKRMDAFGSAFSRRCQQQHSVDGASPGPNGGCGLKHGRILRGSQGDQVQALGQIDFHHFRCDGRSQAGRPTPVGEDGEPFGQRVGGDLTVLGG